MFYGFIVGLVSVLLGSELLLMCDDTLRGVGDVLLVLACLVVGLVVVFGFSY